MNLEQYTGMNGKQIADEIERSAKILAGDINPRLREIYEDKVKELVVVAALMSLRRGLAN